MQSPILCLINRHARSGEEAAEAVAEAFAAAGLPVSLHGVASPDEARALLREHGPGARAVVVGGGDGSISGLAGDLLALGLPVGIVPLGTANDLATSLGIPDDPAQAVAVIAGGVTRAIDLGCCNGRWFVNVASIGFSTEVAKAHKGPRKKWLGVLAYPLAWIDAYRVTRPFSVALTVDDRPVRARCVQFAIGSGRRYGGGLIISEDASHDDGLLWLYWVRPVRMLGWLGELPALLTGRFSRAGRTVNMSAHRVRVETARPKQINVDGELDASTPADFTVRQRALTVFVPADDGTASEPPG
ncbi:MAG: lipid kinase [Alphaproteobacteria bacterium]